jgi:hypothetical protein
MFAPRTWTLGLLLAMLFSSTSPDVLAQRSTTNSPIPTTEKSKSSLHNDIPREAHQPAGSPELGVLIIIMLVGLLVLIAWVFTRVGEGSSRPSDNSLN